MQIEQAEMTNIEISTTHVKVPNNDLQIDAYLARPASTGTFGAVIVFQEIFGVNSNIRDITELIAKQGYVAVAPAMYQRIAPSFEAEFSQKMLGIARKPIRLACNTINKLSIKKS
jgi:carboxymethylenebutenolidase